MRRSKLALNPRKYVATANQPDGGILPTLNPRDYYHISSIGNCYQIIFRDENK